LKELFESTKLLNLLLLTLQKNNWYELDLLVKLFIKFQSPCNKQQLLVSQQASHHQCWGATWTNTTLVTKCILLVITNWRYCDWKWKGLTKISTSGLNLLVFINNNYIWIFIFNIMLNCIQLHSKSNYTCEIFNRNASIIKNNFIRFSTLMQSNK